MAIRSSRFAHEDKWQSEIIGMVAAYAVGCVLVITVLYVAVLYYFAG